ncbi:hypothetical protein HOD05_00440 [Candidatus Woesearchaeota archaeon]|jgi:hypothetical protein|nr:hypothetical protein [Candidatus Woesearchaeota archaeon]MBT4150876.1 hypothetical protein [Candidatus Woesearchaeota archaeon]MBT4246889.1 hypothetical protein [Candidatus Woesearchaeota archaeon]MBT4433666.1 hypothetical protein [Candidatus Woesearchaeota archaeon]
MVYHQKEYVDPFTARASYMRQIARDFAIRDYNSKISKAGLNLLRFRKNFSEGNIQFEDLGNLETVVIKP